MTEFIRWFLRLPEDDEWGLFWWLIVWSAILSFLGGSISAAVFG